MNFRLIYHVLEEGIQTTADVLMPKVFCREENACFN